MDHLFVSIRLPFARWIGNGLPLADRIGLNWMLAGVNGHRSVDIRRSIEETGGPDQVCLENLQADLIGPPV